MFTFAIVCEDTTNIHMTNGNTPHKHTIADLTALRGNLTFTMIKPSAVKAGHTPAIFDMIQSSGFSVLTQREVQLTAETTRHFYAEHYGKYYYEPLEEYMMSGPVVVALLQKEDAVKTFRALIGKTDPAEASPGTIRYRFGTSRRQNAVHGSDSDDTAQREARLFFDIAPISSLVVSPMDMKSTSL